MTDPVAKKQLGQHWLEDQASLGRICEAGQLEGDDLVVEIGPGLGALTEHLVIKAGRVIAVEFDNLLAATLMDRVKVKNLEVANQDCLVYDYASLPKDYKVLANIPYYLTSNLLRVLCENSNPPKIIVLLIQKEVAERVAASPGNMSVLAVTVQYFYEAELDILVEANKFNPVPKVDSQVVVLRRRVKPLFEDVDRDELFRVVKAGFSQKRKKLKTSLSSGLHIGKDKVVNVLNRAGVSADMRPQELSLEQWNQIYQVLKAE